MHGVVVMPVWLSLWSLSRQVQKSLSHTDMLLWKEGESTQSYLRAQDICCVAVFRSSTANVFWKQSSMFHRRTVSSDFPAQYKWNPWACQRCRSWICQTKNCSKEEKWKRHGFILISNNSIFLGIVLILCHGSKTLMESPITSLFKWEDMSTKYARWRQFCQNIW